MSSKLTPKLKPGRLLWAIHLTDREDAHEPSDPLRTVVEAPGQTRRGGTRSPIWFR